MRKSVIAVLVLVSCAFLGIQTAAAQQSTISATANVNGQDLATAGERQPLRLNPAEAADIAVTVTNYGDHPVEIRQVQLDGRVLGLTFFSYITSVDFAAVPGATDTLRYRLDLTGLNGQATGLIGGELILRDSTGAVVATIPTVTDVRGSLISVYGLFGVALAVLTALALLDAAIALARHRLSANRWQRGLRLLAPGIGIGLVLAFSASAVRLWVPVTGQWLLAASACAAALFAIGYFSPTPDGHCDHDDEHDDDERDAKQADDTELDDTELDDTEVDDNDTELALAGGLWR
jgi:hypothetical protein